MGYYAGLNPLRDVLADLYPRANEARTMAVEAGIAEQLIDFDGRSVDFWKSILTTAQNNGQVQSLINIARDQFPKNTLLAEAAQAYEASPAPPLPTLPDAPAAEKNSHGNGDITITVGGDNPGVIGGRDVKDVKIVNVGNVTGNYNTIGIENSVTIGGVPATDETPSFDRFQQMIEELQAVLESVTAQSDLLSQIGPADPSITQGVAQSINKVAAALDTDSDSVNADSITENLSTAATLLEGTLDRAKTLAEKTDATAKAVVPLIQQMGPAVAKIGLAVAWAANMWPAG